MSKSRYVTGLRAVEQLLTGDAAEIQRLYVEYRTSNPRVESVVSRARNAGVDVQSANRARLSQISGETRHQGLVAEVRRSTVLDEASLRDHVESLLTAGQQPLILLLDGLQDPHNLGACLRTADAAGVHAVVVPRHGAAGLGPTVSKVAAGAAEHLPFAAVPNLGRVLDWLGDYGVHRVGTSDRGDSGLHKTQLSGSLALVMGREESGISTGIIKRCDQLIRIPMRGSVASLNVSVATGICLYEAMRQREALAAERDSG